MAIREICGRETSRNYEDWIVVNVLSDLVLEYGPATNEDELFSVSLKRDFLEWARVSINDWSSVQWQAFTIRTRFWFKEPADAMLFKLTFC